MTHRMHVVLNEDEKFVFDKLQDRLSEKRGGKISANQMVREAVYAMAKKEKVQ